MKKSCFCMAPGLFRCPYVVVALAVATLCSVKVHGALRAWEPRDYVRSSLMLHLDGIRNAGADVIHSMNAMTWVDLSGNNRDATLNVHADATGNVWKDDGFYFNNSATFCTADAFALGTQYTIQVLADAPASQTKDFGTFVSPGGFNIGTILYKKSQSGLLHQTDDLIGNIWDTRPGIQSLPSFGYMTAVRDGSRACIFTGTEYPVNTTNEAGYLLRKGWSYGTKSSVAAAKKWTVGGCLTNGIDPHLNYFLKGTIKSVRVYDRMLSEAQLEWNRALDEARFFTKAHVIAAEPVAGAIPDAVVATSVAGAEGREACGSYVVDEEKGHVFAAISATVDTTSYVCTGYTLEAWDADEGTWGAAVPHPGENRCAVAAGDKVRITWQWAAAAGSLLPIVQGYVQDGLVMHYDGICNAGIYCEHDYYAGKWVDLSASRNDLLMTYYDGEGGVCSGINGFRWLPDGFDFDAYSYGTTTRGQNLGTNYTVQLMCETDTSTLKALGMPDGAGFFCANKMANGSIWFKKDAQIQFWANDVIGTVWDTRSYLGEAAWKYITGVRKGDRTTLTTKTTLPADETLARVNGWAVGTKNVSAGTVTWFVGGHLAAADGDGKLWRENGHILKGKMRYVRVYDRVLSDAELARNREIDEARFSGAKLPGTVLVSSSTIRFQGREPEGAYLADGWTFAMLTLTNTVRGIDWVCVGHSVQTWDSETSTWGEAAQSSATEWTSPTGTDYAPRRLTWLWQPVRGARSVVSYAVGDYVGTSLALHLDGIRNAGADAAHDPAATTWKDLSAYGRDAALSIYDGGTGNEWRDNGFFFNASADFTTADTFMLGKRYTIEILADATISQPKGFGTFVSPAAANALRGHVLYKRSDQTLLHQTDDLIGNVWNTRSGIFQPGSFKYITAAREWKRASLFTGASYPANTANVSSSGCYSGWTYQTTCADSEMCRWSVGGWHVSGGEAHTNYFLKGTIKSVRAYDTLLADDDLAWNRKVDNARFFGTLSATNVVVEGKFDDYAGDAPGAYEVFGSHTFTASDATDNKGKSRKILGYTVQAWNGSDWGEAVEHAGGAYEHVVGTSPAKVLLTWRWQSAGTVVIMR